MQRESAVLTGAFTFPDAHLVRAKKSDNEKEVPGDKEQLKPVLTELYARMLKSLRAKFEKDPAHTGLLMPCITRSFKGDQSFFRYMTYRSTETRLLAESTDEPDWVAQGWSKPFEELEESDVEAWCQDMYGLHYLVDGKPQEDLAWFVAGTGNLPLFRYLIETAGLNIEYVGGSGGSALLNASAWRLPFDRRVHLRALQRHPCQPRDGRGQGRPLWFSRRPRRRLLRGPRPVGGDPPRARRQV